MASVKTPLPFEAYRGSEPYIFVSYSHKDGEVVYPLLKELHELGYRVWYDEGIDPGNEWPEEIAKALEQAEHFLVFLTPNAADSRNVRNEINFAINESKPFLAVYLAEFKLPAGLRLRISDIQAILKWRLSDQEYARKLEKTLPDSLRGAGMMTSVASDLEPVGFPSSSFLSRWVVQAREIAMRAHQTVERLALTSMEQSGSGLRTRQKKSGDKKRSGRG